MAAIYVDAKHLPSGDSCNLGFTGIELPSPDEVYARAERNGIDTSRTFRPDPVRFPELGLIVKWGKDITVAEGQCLWFLRQHLKDEVPVPTIYGWQKTDGNTFLYIELIDSKPMAALWEHLAEDDRLSVCEQLRGMIRAWRRIKPESRSPSLLQSLFKAAISLIGIESTQWSSSECRLSALDGGPLRDILFSDGGAYPAGPFGNTTEFHDAFAKLLERDSSDSDAVDPRSYYPELIGLQDDVRVIFTHADLDFSNILLSNPDEGPVRITAIIDWHQSGWYPEPWEWLKAQAVGGPRSTWVKQYLPKVLDPAPYEYFYAWEYINISTI